MKTKNRNIIRLLLQKKLDAVLITDPYDISYISGFANFSSEEREGFLFVTKTGSYIITDGRYDEAVEKQTDGFTVLTRSHDNKLEDILTELIEKHKIKHIGFDEDDLSAAEYVKYKKLFGKFIPFSIKELRITKTSDEIQKIQKACSLGDEAFKYILGKLKSGVTEKEIAFEMEIFIRKKGADLSFPSIVAFGANSSVPHHLTGNTKLKKGDFVLLDFGVKYENYCSDMTRTIVFGKPSDKQKKTHATVLEAQQKAVKYVENFYSSSERSESRSKSSRFRSNNKLKLSSLDRVAREYIISQGYPTIPHSLGHGIGLEVHETPSLSPGSKETLDEGMVFSIEPGIYIPGFGGVRIEDLFAIQKGKLVKLTKSPHAITP